jgi:hypothetical protein
VEQGGITMLAEVISTLVTCSLLRIKRLDDLLMQEGFAFSHCTTCKAQFHLRPELHEDHSWRKMKFKYFVAQDVFLIFLVVQTVCQSHFFLIFVFLLGWQGLLKPTQNATVIATLDQLDIVGFFI